MVANIKSQSPFEVKRAKPAPAPREIAVRVQDLVKTYRDGTEANRGISLEVRRGEVVAIVGPNGAGKTTFLRQLTTELRPTAGSVSVFGVDAVLLAETDKSVGALSGGQRRRILIGLALLGRPPLLVLDEPTTGLDPASRRAVWSVIRRAVNTGTTIILSTHYMEEAERLRDRIGVIASGRLLAFGTLDDLLARLDRSYRLSYRDSIDPLSDSKVHYCASFAQAQQHIARELLSEYSIARASLEDVYFTLTGEPFDKDETETIG